VDDARAEGRARDDARGELAAFGGLGLGLAGWLARGAADLCGTEADTVGRGVVRTPGAGLNVATESIAPATRQMARMLASRGMIVPFLVSGPASRFRARRRRWARSSRW
jgi:hypothetical protein